jgi:NAD(P)-dependent dehydrogenase (short-subunit alcohol dehydrogenase family)
MSGQLDGKVAWVTGAAGAIGRAVCKTFIAEGARLVLSGRNESTLQGLAASLDDIGNGPSMVVPLDVTNGAAVDAATARIIAKSGGVDILVNSTTNPIFGDFLDLSDEDWQAVLDAKFMAYMRVSRAVIPHMAAGSGGAIVNVSGRGGHQPNSPSHLAGSCANGAVNTLTKGLANLYGPRGIRVNAVAPGPVISPRYERIKAANLAVAIKRGSAERSGVAAASPLGEMAEVDEIADIVLFLAGPQSRFMTGCVLQADGGGTAAL